MTEAEKRQKWQKWVTLSEKHSKMWAEEAKMGLKVAFQAKSGKKKGVESI